ncbi:unnamed protein product [Dicrocoelium dendriticum]|nr:unnamed protein product [Dicrocoelium dendriticum]
MRTCSAEEIPLDSPLTCNSELKSGLRTSGVKIGSIPKRSRAKSVRQKATKWFASHHIEERNGSHHVVQNPGSKDQAVNNGKQETPSTEQLLLGEFMLQRRISSKRARLNVGGENHEVMWSTLGVLPKSRLGRLYLSNCPAEMIHLCDDYVADKNEYYFDRSARSFGAILGLYRTGHLHILDDVCVIALKDDLDYWGISEHSLDACCMQRYYRRKEQMDDEIKKTYEISLQQVREEQFGVGRCANIQRRVWDLLEKPQTSMAARVFAVISIIFIVLSILGLNLSTLPELRGNITSPNITARSRMDGQHTLDPSLEILELVCTIWFTLEYVVRFCVAPNKCEFAKSFMNLIDVVAILPFYFSKIFEFWLDSTVDSLVSVRKVVQMFRILRILRVFKLARHSQGLQALGYTVAQSYKELGLLMMFVVLVVLLFSSLAYFAEKDENPDMFSSIPATFWWSIITMTTVGYGDITPKTALGKLIGSVCCICGVLVVGLPIPIIVNNFAAFYQDQARREKLFRQKESAEMHSRMSSRNYTRKSSACFGVPGHTECPLGCDATHIPGTNEQLNSGTVQNHSGNPVVTLDHTVQQTDISLQFGDADSPRTN